MYFFFGSSILLSVIPASFIFFTLCCFVSISCYFVFFIYYCIVSWVLFFISSFLSSFCTISWCLFIYICFFTFLPSLTFISSSYTPLTLLLLLLIHTFPAFHKLHQGQHHMALLWLPLILHSLPYLKSTSNTVTLFHPHGR